jgi:hypothetical protein
MERFIQLNLHNDSEKAEAEKLPRPEGNEPVEIDKKLNRIANKAAHKAAKEFTHGSSGIFSK